MSNEVQATADVYRIYNLPRRRWDEASLQACQQHMTRLLRHPMGSMTLRPVQAIALYELSQCGGLFGIIAVGEGKTLIAFLAPRCVPNVRPLLVMPAKLIDEKKRELRALSIHFQVALNLRIISYEWLGRPQASRMLEEYRPDLIVTDESHKLRNTRPAVTRRLGRYINAHKPKLVVMSGTMCKRSLKDYSHLLRWALGKDRAPIPALENEIDEWADALDERVVVTRRMGAGALVMFADDASLEGVRKGFYQRLTDTQGVIATTESKLATSLVIRAVEPPLHANTDTAMAILRAKWETPDGWPIADAFEYTRHAREIALGFFYRWNPRPPDEWYYPRKAWAHICREIIRHSKHLDSEATVAGAIIAGEIECPEYWQWKEVQNRFIPQTEIVWHDWSVLQYCVHWMQKPGIVWTEHVQFAQALAHYSGCAYYGRKGIDKRTGAFIEHVGNSRSIIASIKSNSEGRNLQYKWHRNLIVSIPANGPQVEQLLGRTHRPGQEADEVSVDFIMTCVEHFGAIEQAKRDSAFTASTQGQTYKILYADLVMPSMHDIVSRQGPRWQAGA